MKTRYNPPPDNCISSNAMFSQDRKQLRRMFFTAWQKHLKQQAMDPLEELIAAIVRQHPEYHAMLNDPAIHLDKDFTPEMGQTNPFLHMAMHIAIQEQLATRRPAGILELYQTLLTDRGDPHEAEHQMMECLGQMIWQAQRSNTPPNEETYLACLKKLCKQN